MRPLRVCFTGRNRAGSWEVRGNQVSRGRSEWVANQDVDAVDLEHFDLLCFVKRPIPKLMEAAKARKIPIVYDVVDAWAQPGDHGKVTDRESARALFSEKWADIPRFDAFIFANRKMFNDLSAVAGPSTYIYHHYREGMGRNPMRQNVEKIGYEGNENYLGEWRPVLQDFCASKGIEFVVNPERLSDLDIGVSCRGGEFSCYLTNNYKSNVKLANWFGVGTPAVIHADEISCQETDNGDVLFFRDEVQLRRQLTRLIEDFSLRERLHSSFLLAASRFEFNWIVAQYESFFRRVVALHSSH